MKFFEAIDVPPVGNYWIIMGNIIILHNTEIAAKGETVNKQPRQDRWGCLFSIILLKQNVWVWKTDLNKHT
jgi:hypothetical protein